MFTLTKSQSTKVRLTFINQQRTYCKTETTLKAISMKLHAIFLHCASQYCTFLAALFYVFRFLSKACRRRLFLSIFFSLNTNWSQVCWDCDMTSYTSIKYRPSQLQFCMRVPSQSSCIELHHKHFFILCASIP